MVRLGIPLVLLAGCGRWGFPSESGDGVVDVVDDAGAPSDAFNLSSDAPPGTTIVSFGEASGVTYAGVTQDNWISELFPNGNYGLDPMLFVRGPPQVLGTALLRFELSALPPTTTIVAAELHLYVVYTDGGAITVHRALESWTEGTKTGGTGVSNWSERHVGVTWATAGALAPGSHDPTVLGTGLPAGADTSLIVAVDPAVVQSWVDGSAENHGLALASTADRTELRSSNAVSDVVRPVLVLAIR